MIAFVVGAALLLLILASAGGRTRKDVKEADHLWVASADSGSPIVAMSCGGERIRGDWTQQQWGITLEPTLCERVVTVAKRTLGLGPRLRTTYWLTSDVTRTLDGVSWRRHDSAEYVRAADERALRRAKAAVRRARREYDSEPDPHGR